MAFHPSSGASHSQQLVLMLKEELPHCHNRERADAFAVKFCQHNTKSGRKKLVRALFEAPRQALDLLPQYARLVATLDQVQLLLYVPLLLILQHAHSCSYMYSWWYAGQAHSA